MSWSLSSKGDLSFRTEAKLFLLVMGSTIPTGMCSRWPRRLMSWSRFADVRSATHPSANFKAPTG
eukprot:3834067-Pyramimonas_sp.AAC.1